jgi:hypothetical protein
MQMSDQALAEVLARLDRIESVLTEFVHQGTVHYWFTTDQAARILGKAPFTIREWCRNGRVHCRKQNTGRGAHRAWVISREELNRIQREGLLPLKTVSSRI